jgi:subtilase family serine protease
VAIKNWLKGWEVKARSSFHSRFQGYLQSLRDRLYCNNSYWRGARRRSPRLASPGLEGLEERIVPNAAPPYNATQIRAAYGVNGITFGNVPGDGTGQTIAIVDSFNDPNIQTDLAQFDKTEGLPAPPSFKVFNEAGLNITSQVTTGGLNVPQNAPLGGIWGEEISLDVEWAHAIAPGAAIDLVECTGPFAHLFTGDINAAQLPGVSVVSNSWGEGEFSGETSTSGGISDHIFTTPIGHQGVVFLAATLDSGYPGAYPAYSPNVVAVGGTTLVLNNDGSYQSESAWVGSGGGTSEYENEPSYQIGFQNSLSRTIPDVAFDGGTNVWIYDSYNFPKAPLHSGAGTSLSAPCWAGLVAIADQGRVLAGGSTFNSSTNPTQILTALYSLPDADFNDIVAGNNDQVTGVTITNGGSGYAETQVSFGLDGGGTGAAGTVTTSNGGVTGINITSGGTGYTSPPTVTISGGGTGATGVATLNAAGQITGVTIKNGGSGYLSVDFSGGGGSGATGEPEVTAGSSQA